MKPCQHNISSVVENSEKVQPFFPYTANLLENKTLLPAAYFCFFATKTWSPHAKKWALFQRKVYFDAILV